MIRARGQLMRLAMQASVLNGGHAAHRLSAYALLVGDRTQQADAIAELTGEMVLAESMPNEPLALVLREALDVVRDLWLEPTR